MGKVGFQNNFYDNLSLAKIYAQREFTTSTVLVQSLGWVMGTAMAGPFGSFKIKEKFHLEPRALFGLAVVGLPEVKITYNRSGDISSNIFKSGSGASFSYLFGLALKYDLKPKVCIWGSLDYFGTRTEIIGEKYIDGSNKIDLPEYFQDIASINLSVGVGFSLGKEGK